MYYTISHGIHGIISKKQREDKLFIFAQDKSNFFTNFCRITKQVIFKIIQLVFQNLSLTG